MSHRRMLTDDHVPPVTFFILESFSPDSQPRQLVTHPRNHMYLRLHPLNPHSLQLMWATVFSLHPRVLELSVTRRIRIRQYSSQPCSSTIWLEATLRFTQRSPEPQSAQVSLRITHLHSTDYNKQRSSHNLPPTPKHTSFTELSRTLLLVELSTAYSNSPYITNPSSKSRRVIRTSHNFFHPWRCNTSFRSCS